MDAALHAPLSTTIRRRAGRDKPATDPSISLVLPAFNEEAVISRAIDEAETALAQVCSDYEILVVDDGSRDDTLKIARFEASHRPCVRVISHDENRGYGAALRTGFAAAGKRIIGFTDADCQFDLRQLSRLLMLLTSCDIACGYRIDRQDSALRILYSRTYNALIRLLLGVPVRDCDCAMKLFHRDVLETVSVDTNGFLVNAELLAKAQLQGKQIVEVGVNHRPRAAGASTVSIWHAVPVLITLVRFWWSHLLFPRTAQVREPDADSKHRTLLTTVGLAMLCAVVFFLHLSYPLFEPDENRYAQIAMEMVESGEYLVPRLLGEPYLDKPPLLYWATAVSFHMFGASESAARFVPALAASWTVLITFLLGQRLCGYRIARTGSILLFLCIGFLLAGRYILMDGLLTCFTTTSLLAGFLAISQPQLRWRWFLVAAISCGLGMMTKGPIALFLTLPPLIALPWLNQSLARVGFRHLLVYTAVAVSMTLPWFVCVVLTQPEFAGHFLWKHHVLRFVAAFDHQAPFWFYLPTLLIGMFPCSLLTAPCIALLLSRTKQARNVRSAELGFLVFTAGWIVLFFSASSCKLPTYVLPAIPLLCLIAAHVVCATRAGVTTLPLSTLTSYLPFCATAAVVLIGIGLAIANLVTRQNTTIWSAVDWLVIFVPVSILACRLALHFKRTLQATPWSVAAATSIAIALFAFQCFVPQYADYRSVHANAARVQIDTEGPPRPVAYLDWQIDAQFLYYSERPAVHFTEEELNSLMKYMAGNREVVLVANRDSAERLRARLGPATKFNRTPGARGRVYLVCRGSLHDR